MAATTNTNLDCSADGAVASGHVSRPAMFPLLLPVLLAAGTAAAESLERLVVLQVHM